MIRNIALTLALATLCTPMGFAQDNSRDKPKSSERTITGCVMKSGNDKFELEANDGSKWNLNSDTVEFASHTGHTVTVTGVVARTMAHNLKEDSKDAATDAHLKKNDNEHGTLKVTDLKMVSKSCEK